MNPIPIIMNLTGLGKAASTVALIVFLFAVFGMAKCSYDASVITEYEAGVQADVTDATGKAGAAADTEAAKYETEFGKRQTKDKKDIDDAKVTGSSPFDSWNAPVKRVQQPASADRKRPD